MTGQPPSRLSVVLATLLACGLVAGLAVPAAVGASDIATILYFDENDVDAEAGETVTLDLVVSSQGDHFGNGADELSFTVAYDPDVFTVTDVENGPMLADGDSDVEVNESVEIDDGAGTVTVTQKRDPSGDGAKATDVAAILTLEVAEDAPSSAETVDITDASAVSVIGSPLATVEREATINIGDVEDTDGDEARADSGDDTGDDPVPGFTVPLAVVGIVAFLSQFVRR